jgi:hypothetical protein
MAGHCRVLCGIDDDNNFIAADPLPDVRRVVNPYSFYFSAIPAVVAWKSLRNIQAYEPMLPISTVFVIAI